MGVIETGEITTELIDILTSHVIFISKIIYNTEYITSFKLKEEILNKYKKLTGQSKWYFNLIGPQPVTLLRNNVKIKSKHPIYKLCSNRKGRWRKISTIYNKWKWISNKC